MGDKTGGSGPSVFSKDGAIGHMFQRTSTASFKVSSATKEDITSVVGADFDLTADGAIGGTAQKVGGPFDKDGIIGSNFTADGSIGGTVQKTVEKK